MNAHDRKYHGRIFFGKLRLALGAQILTPLRWEHAHGFQMLDLGLRIGIEAFIGRDRVREDGIAAERWYGERAQYRNGGRNRLVHVVGMPDVGAALNDAVRFHFQNERIAGGRSDRMRF